MTRRAGGKRFARIAAAGVVLIAGWALATAVAAANRHQLPPPTRSAPDAGGRDPAESLSALAPGHAFLARHTSASAPGENSVLAKSP